LTSLLGLLLALQSPPAPPQLTPTELSLGATTALVRRSFVGAELGAAHRPSGESRIALALAGGAAAGRAAARAQLTLQLLVNAASRSSVGLYAGVGAAAITRRGSPGQGFVALLLGIEEKPGRRRGWYIESGFGGGVRIAAGWRARWFPSWWRGS
jgi:hypothetical protein